MADEFNILDTPTGLFSASYNSGEQTITTQGLLTLAHGLGAEPAFMQAFLINKTAQHNYTPGEVVPIHLMRAGESAKGISIVADSTNIEVRYGNVTFVWTLLDHLTGTDGLLTNSFWRFLIKAWA